MTNRGVWTNTPTGFTKVTIPVGYHNDSGYVNKATVYTNGYNDGVATTEAKSMTHVGTICYFRNQTVDISSA